jgi:hypothetical protein
LRRLGGSGALLGRRSLDSAALDDAALDNAALDNAALDNAAVDNWRSTSGGAVGHRAVAEISRSRDDGNFVGFRSGSLDSWGSSGLSSGDRSLRCRRGVVPSGCGGGLRVALFTLAGWPSGLRALLASASRLSGLRAVGDGRGASRLSGLRAVLALAAGRVGGSRSLLLAVLTVASGGRLSGSRRNGHRYYWGRSLGNLGRRRWVVRDLRVAVETDVVETNLAAVLGALVVATKIHIHVLRATALGVLQRGTACGARGMLLADGAISHLVVQFKLGVEFGGQVHVGNGEIAVFAAERSGLVLADVVLDDLAAEMPLALQIALTKGVGAAPSLGEVEISVVFNLVTVLEVAPVEATLLLIVALILAEVGRLEVLVEIPVGGCLLGSKARKHKGVCCLHSEGDAKVLNKECTKFWE